MCFSLSFDLNASDAYICLSLNKREWRGLTKFLKLTNDKKLLPKNTLNCFSLDIPTGKIIYIVKDKEIQKEILKKTGEISMTVDPGKKLLTFDGGHIWLDKEMFQRLRTLCLKS